MKTKNKKLELMQEDPVAYATLVSNWMDKTVSAQLYISYTKPLIYGWFRYDLCLYIGKSENGIARPFDIEHHVINKAEPVLPEDDFRFFVIPNHPSLSLSLIEQQFIRYYRPKYNQIHNKENYEPTEYMSAVSSKVHPKEKLAKILQREMQEPILLGTPHISNEELRKLSREDLERRIKHTALKMKVMEELKETNFDHLDEAFKTLTATRHYEPKQTT